ncbi:MAG: succinate dehydrogenase/fumarate reductase iron-sulfur subunit [Hyphomicrobiaceae bacterium]
MTGTQSGNAPVSAAGGREPLQTAGDRAPQEGTQRTIAVSIWRGGQEGRYEVFQVPLRESQTVLDVVTHVQRHLDPTLSYRFACRVGVCGSCAMTVNGRPRWTCRTHVSKVVENGKLEIGPLANLPVIKDLATNMVPFFEKWQDAKGVFKPTETRNDPVSSISPQSKERQINDAAIECINCGVCFSACDTVRWNDDYMGPAALNRAWTLVNDMRDGGQGDRLFAVAQGGGCHACHTHQSCEQHCPVGLNPTASIAGLKRRTMHAYIRGELP